MSDDLIHNHSNERLATNVSLPWFVEAIQSLDMSQIPPNRRSDAMHEHLMRIMAHSIDDPQIQADLHKAIESMQFRKSLTI